MSIKIVHVIATSAMSWMTWLNDVKLTSPQSYMDRPSKIFSYRGAAVDYVSMTTGKREYGRGAWQLWYYVRSITNITRSYELTIIQEINMDEGFWSQDVR